ncbi:LPXTG cell wall anchor domain-containing protein [Aquibacillus halophilus]|uniref:LPXTG cell wall anchor domain-containing protein n=1 Tax=Aquibacillus halophilus TaxID=930132 RepID=UPI0014790FDD
MVLRAISITAETNHFSVFTVFELAVTDEPVDGEPGEENPGTEQPSKEEPTKQDPKTEDQDKSPNEDGLPDTATSMFSFMILGLLLLLVGFGTLAARKRFARR